MGAGAGAAEMTHRDAFPADRAAWGRLWQGFLDYYDTTLPPAVTRRPGRA